MNRNGHEKIPEIEGKPDAFHNYRQDSGVICH